MNQDLLIDIDLKPRKILSTKIIIILIIAIIILAIANVFIMTEKIPDNVTRLDGSIASTEFVTKSIYLTILITIPVVCFILSLLLSLIPFKGRTYGQKYLPFSLFLLLGIQVIIFINIWVEHLWN